MAHLDVLECIKQSSSLAISVIVLSRFSFLLLNSDIRLFLLNFSNAAIVIDKSSTRIVIYILLNCHGFSAPWSCCILTFSYLLHTVGLSWSTVIFFGIKAQNSSSCYHCTKNEVFSLRVSLVHVTKSTVVSGFGQIYWRYP